MRLLTSLVEVTGAKHQHAGRLGRPLLLDAVLHDLAVQFADCVPARVAVVDHFVKAVQLASLLFRVEAGQVLSGHQLAPQRFTTEADLVCGRRRHADDVRGVFHGTKDLKHICVPICLSIAMLLLIKLAGFPGAG